MGKLEKIENYQNVTKRQYKQMLLEKRCLHTCSIKGCQKPLICKKKKMQLSAKCNKAKQNEAYLYKSIKFFFSISFLLDYRQMFLFIDA